MALGLPASRSGGLVAMAGLAAMTVAWASGSTRASLRPRARPRCCAAQDGKVIATAQASCGRACGSCPLNKGAPGHVTPGLEDAVVMDADAAGPLRPSAEGAPLRAEDVFTKHGGPRSAAAAFISSAKASCEHPDREDPYLCGDCP
eukprot:CAMPEP_0180762760 /NCGR_PEP_ID=MMETSP1038_2-20121128/37544_1 /TAXON_ID=632150 /ORGANISM="Azadinium spinosum, Strain 3D9" /LENGTH=145 /DNA_ID=CAMNT_0022797047 /DNA_START=204 /DNA_END=637 /DNA_ORIENTATION=+